MAREVGWAESAVEDLESIAAYISRDSEAYATAVVRELVRAAGSLSELAERGRQIPEYGDPTVREIFVCNYRLVYQVLPETVKILGIIHGARTMPPLEGS